MSASSTLNVIVRRQHVRIAAAVRGALIKLGWTPPRKDADRA